MKTKSVVKSHTVPEVLVRLLFLRLFSVASSLLEPALFESAEEPVCFTIADLSNFRLSGITAGTTGQAEAAPVGLSICSKMV